MRGLSSLPLDDDIIDRILIFLPDYPTLLATILSSKSFYDVFKNHPNSIIRAISYNLVGPALPQAVRVIRYSAPDPEAPADPDSSPWQETDSVSPITNEECQLLARNAGVVNELENIFSSRYKSRSSQIRILDSMESWRFRRALYRAMLFSKAFPTEDYENMDEDHVDPEELRQIRLQRKKLLAEFSNRELCELRSATFFLIEVAKWAAVADGSDLDEDLESGDVILACGPAEVLSAYQTKTIDGIAGNPIIGGGVVPPALEEYISHPLDQIWVERKEKLPPPPDDAKHWESILEGINGEEDTCQKCSNGHGFDLWNETNWEDLRGASLDLTLSKLHSLIKGKLSRNPVEGDALITRFDQPTFTYTKLLNEIHQVRTTPYDSWNKQDWLCVPCITEILRSHLHLWLLERKKESGEKIPVEDCWYGYNCNTQEHKRQHATRVNHLCEPIR